MNTHVPTHTHQQDIVIILHISHAHTRRAATTIVIDWAAAERGENAACPGLASSSHIGVRDSRDLTPEGAAPRTVRASGANILHTVIPIRALTRARALHATAASACHLDLFIDALRTVAALLLRR